jgi:hypothetical protein
MAQMTQTGPQMTQIAAGQERHRPAERPKAARPR